MAKKSPEQSTHDPDDSALFSMFRPIRIFEKTPEKKSVPEVWECDYCSLEIYKGPFFKAIKLMYDHNIAYHPTHTASCRLKPQKTRTDSISPHPIPSKPQSNSSKNK